MTWMASYRQWVEWAVALIALGWGLPKLLGVVYSDTLLYLTYAGLAILFSAPKVTGRVFGDRSRGVLPAAHLWRHLAAGTGFGLLSFAALMIIQDVMMRWRSGGQIGFDYLASGRLFLLAGACSAFGSGLAAALTVKMGTLQQSRLALRAVFLAALMVAIYGLRRLSDDTRFDLMTMAAGGSPWGMFVAVAGTLLAAGAVLGVAASRAGQYRGG